MQTAHHPAVTVIDAGVDRLVPVDLFDGAAIGMAFVSLDGRFVRVNESLCELLGRDRDALLSATWAELTHPDDLGSSREQAEALMSGARHRIDFQKRYLRPDGEIVTARVTSALTVVDGQSVLFSQLHDMTDEATALAGMLAAERRFEALTSTSSDAVYWLQLQPEVRFRYVNDAAAAITGYVAEDIYADPELRHQIVHPDDRHLLEEMRTGSIGAGAARLRWVHRDGSVIWVEQQVSVLAEANGVVTDVLGVARNVSDRVESEQAWVRHSAQRTAVTDLARACLSSHDPGDILDQAIAAVARLTSADAVAVWWETEPDGGLQLAAGAGFMDLAVGSVVDAFASHPARVRANKGCTSYEPSSAASDRPDAVELVREGIDNGTGVAIRSDGRVVGALAAYSRTTRTIPPEDSLFIQTIASTVSACAERVQFDGQLGQLAMLDPLTGLLNRSALLARLADALEAAGELPVSIGVCDLDDFGLLNEAQGNASGDEALRGVATSLRQIFGAGAAIGRVGGDEFAVVIPSESGVPGELLARQMMIELEHRASEHASRGSVTVSIGFASGRAEDTANDLLAAALSALADAQERGRSQWSHSSGHTPGDAQRRHELTNGLRGAVSRGEIRAHFQPIVRLRQGGSIVGFEALARWERPDGTTVPPGEFVPIAEQTGFIRDVGLTMLDQACAFLQQARTLEPDRELMVTVNVSPRQLDDPELPARFAEVLARYSIPRPAICLELTESSLVPGDVPMVDRLHNLRRLGVSLAIDDFGSGYSSFAYLTQLPIDLLKLDRALVTDLQEDPRRIAVARSIISLARELGIVVLAEGIETELERDAMRDLDCELGQGYLWSRPVPPVDALALIGPEVPRKPCESTDPRCAEGCAASRVHRGPPRPALRLRQAAKR
jgi:diguanylate cyclase (GGDEF)-like protein/PAS domain S-box-containing protein